MSKESRKKLREESIKEAIKELKKVEDARTDYKKGDFFNSNFNCPSKECKNKHYWSEPFRKIEQNAYCFFTKRCHRTRT